jgi:hypothetical protein
LAYRIPARLSSTEGRRFGLTVGAAFLALTALLYWRQVFVGASVTAVVGVGLVLSGIVIPTRLGPVYRGWMGFALRLSRITSPIFFGIVYYLVFTPIGVAMRILGRDPLVRTRAGSNWVARGGRTEGRGGMGHQF